MKITVNKTVSNPIETKIEISIPSFWVNDIGFFYIKVIDDKFCLEIQDMEEHFAPIDSIKKTYLPENFARWEEITEDEFKKVYDEVLFRLKP